MKVSGATILIVDDEPELLEIFAQWMLREGYNVLTAANGAEALRTLTSRAVDALISDIRMPIMDGLVLVRRIWEMNLLVPSIIFVSGFGDVNVREMHALGVEAMLPKPLGRKQLLGALEASLTNRDLLWLTPAEGVSDQLELQYESLEESSVNGDFSIGRGGVCLRSDRLFLEDSLLKVVVNFSRNELQMRGQGRVRWCSPKDHHLGLAFVYLEPDSRGWIIEHMQGKALHSFIPACGPT